MRGTLKWLTLATLTSAAPTGASPPDAGLQQPPPGQLRSVVEAVLAEHREQLAACAAAQKRSALSAGVTWMHWRIEPSGDVTDAHVVTFTGPDASFAHCLETALYTWHFHSEPFQDVALVDWPFAYEARPPPDTGPSPFICGYEPSREPRPPAPPPPPVSAPPVSAPPAAPLDAGPPLLCSRDPLCNVAHTALGNAVEEGVAHLSAESCMCWTVGCPPDPSKPWCPPPKTPEPLPTTPDGSISCDHSPMYAVAAHKDQLKVCIRKQLAAHPDVSGRAEMHWVIKPNGDVTDVRCTNEDARNAVMARCLKDAISNWKFDKRYDGKTAPIDFLFKF